MCLLRYLLVLGGAIAIFNGATWEEVVVGGVGGEGGGGGVILVDVVSLRGRVDMDFGLPDGHGINFIF